jgi:NAD(P)H-hydrate epimerase
MNNLKKIYPRRNFWAHKGDFGYVLIVSGSEVYSGSPVFNAMAALRAGADLVNVVGHRRAMDIAAAFAPDIITRLLDSELSSKHVKKIIELSKNFNSLIIGGGLKRSEETFKAVREIIKKVNLPMVIDAEAIRAVAKDKKILKGKNAIITPHSEEFRILTGEKVKPEISDRKTKVKKWAKILGVTILLKGHIDVISDGKQVVLNKTGSPYMTKGGFGDTLAGICGALLARRIKPLAAAAAAAYINGRAGELAAKDYGESVLASDIFEFIPKVIK